MKRSFILLIALFSVISFVFASPLQQVATITTKEGKSVDGFVKFYKNTTTPNFIQFCETEFGKYQEYTSSDLSGFICGVEKFISAEVEVEISSTNTLTLEENSKPNLILKNVFLEVLIEGDNALYLYISDDKKYNYYYKDSDGKLRLYIQKFYKQIKDNKVLKIENITYKKQLNENLACNLEFKQTPQSDYNLKYFKALYDECYMSSESKPSYIAVKRQNYYELGLIASVNGTLHHNFSKDNLASNAIEDGIMAGGLYFQLRNRNQKSSFISEILYTSNVHHDTFRKDFFRENYFEIWESNAIYRNVINFNFYLQFPYQLYKKDLFFNAGLNSLYNFSSTNLTRHYYQFYSTVIDEIIIGESNIQSVGLLFGTGIDLGKMKIEARYNSNLFFNSSFDRFSLLCSYNLISSKK